MTKNKYPVDIIKVKMSLEGKYYYFAKVKRYLWENLDSALPEGLNKTKWVKDMCKIQFGIDLISIEALDKLEQTLAASQIYLDISDWLGDTIRHNINCR